jgi:hypothetical protein
MQTALYLVESDITPELARVDAEINALSKRIRHMSDRQINTAPHVALVKARRGLLATRSALLARQCELALSN